MSTTFAKERTLQDEIAPAIEVRVPGVEVLAVELPSPSRIRVYIDHEDGVDHALCERVSVALRPFLDEYSVEVSSPGLNRPLRTRAHFERAVGRRVRVKTDDHRLRGEVASAGARSFRLQKETGEPVEVPYDEVVRANLIHEG